MICRRATHFTGPEVIEYYQKRAAEIASPRKLKTTQQIMPDTLR